MNAPARPARVGAGRATCVIVALALALAAAGCDSDSSTRDPDADRDFRQDMMDFVADLSAWARTQDADFIVVPQNGPDIYSADYEADDPIDAEYFAAIDAIGQEDLRYGYDEDNVATDPDVTAEIEAFLDVYLAEGKVVLVTDYIDTAGGITSSRDGNDAKGYLSFQGTRDLDNVPNTPDPATPHFYDTGAADTDLSTVNNFLYVLDPGGWGSKSAYLSDLGNTNHDLLIVDAFDNDQNVLTGANVTGLKTANDGSARLAIAYMSIGEAEDFRYYWDADWEKKKHRPDWLDKPNPDWPGDYKVRYWYGAWQDIIFGNADSYLQMILDAGFDGVYLDIIDGFEYWEEKIGR